VPESIPGAQPAAPNVRTFQPFSSLVQVDVSGLSHGGRVRPNNEDHFFVTRIGRYMETLLTSLPEGAVPQRAEEAGYSLVVADGMGGHAAGEVASRLAISTLVNLALEAPDWILRIDEQMAPEVKRRVKRRVRDVNAVLIDQGEKDKSLRGMGTTLTVLRTIGRYGVVFHVGDSRAYLLRDGRLHRLTRDHTYAQLLVDVGAMPASAAARSRFRHTLTNTLGGFGQDVEVDVDRVELQDRDRVLLCTDGLTDELDDATIEHVLATGTSQAICHRLLELALEAGGRDNITMIVAVYTFPAAAAS
jgi:PPM family protein phosphatase